MHMEEAFTVVAVAFEAVAEASDIQGDRVPHMNSASSDDRAES